MNITTYTKANQLIPVSEARAKLSKLIDNISQIDFLVVMKKYQPKAVLVDLVFFDKIITIYKQWQRKQDFSSLRQIRNTIPVYDSKEAERDIKNAIKEIRKSS